MKQMKIELYEDYKAGTWSWFVFEYVDEFWCNIGHDVCYNYEDASKEAYKFYNGVKEKMTNISKYISLILRHKPEVIGIRITEHGYVNCSELIDGVKKKYPDFDAETLKRIVADDEKQRYSFNNDKTMIRANQGHSIPVDIEYESPTPPDVLYHGTCHRSLKSILEKGILPMKRQYVHLSSDISTAIAVGKRHGDPIVLEVDCKQMIEDGFKFYISENGVWLTNTIPSIYIDKRIYIEKERK